MPTKKETVEAKNQQLDGPVDLPNDPQPDNDTSVNDAAAVENAPVAQADQKELSALMAKRKKINDERVAISKDDTILPEAKRFAQVAALKAELDDLDEKITPLLPDEAK